MGTDQRTYRPTDQRIDGLTEKASYRDAWMQHKSESLSEANGSRCEVAKMIGVEAIKKSQDRDQIRCQW